MDFFNNLKIATRLKLVLGVMTVMLFGMAGLSLWQMKAMDASTREITTNWLPSVELVNQMNTAAANYRAQEFKHVLSTDAQEMAAVEKRIGDYKAAFDKSHDAYVKLISSEQERKIYESFAADWKQYLQIHERMLEASRKNENDQAKTLMNQDSVPVYRRLSASLEQLVALNNDGAEAEAKRSDDVSVRAQYLMGGAALVGLVLAIAASLWLVRSIVGPLNQAVEVADRVAAGDLTGSFGATSQDEAGLLLQALARMQSALVGVVASVRTGSESVATASSEIAQGNNDLSQRTEEQASALEETAASMEELSSTVKQNADNARQANQLAQNASSVAVKGGEVVAQVVDTMKDINDSSRKISDIIAVIDGIAFQTNILALNAAVEAARAGEQGRGFAVVASEVRSLAGRSAEAAKEIKNLISTSVERVEQGTALVDQAGTTMTEVVASIRRVNDIMGEISAASNEQSQGVSQIGEAITQMDQVTQQNAALVEEMAAAASSLKSQAQELVGTVAVFKLGAGQEGGFAAPPARTTAVSAPKSFAAGKKVVAKAAPKAQPKPASLGHDSTAKAGNDEWESF